MIHSLSDFRPAYFFYVDFPACGSIRHHYLLLAQIRHPAFVPPPLLTQIIVRRVHRQPVQPRLEYFRRPQLVQGIIQSQKYFLPNVFNVFRPADEPRYRTQDPFTVRLHHLVEGTIIAASSPFYEFEVNQHDRRHSQCYRRY